MVFQSNESLMAFHALIFLHTEWMSVCEFFLQDVDLSGANWQNKRPKQKDCEIPLSHSPKTLPLRKQELSRENKNARRKKDVMW